MSEYVQNGMLMLAQIPDGFDVSRKIPTLTIVCMILSLIVMIGVPVGYLLFMRKRVDMNLRGMLSGAIAYMAAMMLGYNLLGSGLSVIPGMVDYLDKAPAVAGVINAVLLIVLELAGIFCGLKFVSRKGMQFQDAVMFSFGFVGLIIIISSAANMFSLIMNAVMINSQGLDYLFNNLAEGTDIQQLAAACNELIEANSFQFLIDGVHSLLTFMLRTMECLFIYAVITGKSSGRTLAAAIGATAFYNIAVMLYSIGILSSQWLIELIIAVGAIALGWYCKILFQSELAEEWKILTTKRKNNRPGRFNKNQPNEKMPKIVMPKN